MFLCRFESRERHTEIDAQSSGSPDIALELNEPIIGTPLTEEVPISITDTRWTSPRGRVDKPLHSLLAFGDAGGRHPMQQHNPNPG